MTAPSTRNASRRSTAANSRSGEDRALWGEEPDWGKWEGMADRFAVARYTAIVLRELRAGRPTPEVPAEIGEDLRPRMVTLGEDLTAAQLVIAGDSVAGEANIGTLRYLLTIPAGRTRLLAVKFAAIVISALVAEYFGGPIGGLGKSITSAASSSDYPLAWAYVLGAIVLGLAPALITAFIALGGGGGGVDDARDLREKAFFAPVRDRYKVYIIDEAHMVSSQGFNALLKLVEEPPELEEAPIEVEEPTITLDERPAPAPTSMTATASLGLRTGA